MCPFRGEHSSSSSDVTDILRSPSVAVSRVSLNSLGPPRYFWQVVSAFPQRDVCKVEQHAYCRPALAPRRRLRVRLIGCCTEKRQPVPGYHSSHSIVCKAAGHIGVASLQRSVMLVISPGTASCLLPRIPPGSGLGPEHPVPTPVPSRVDAPCRP